MAPTCIHTMYAYMYVCVEIDIYIYMICVCVPIALLVQICGSSVGKCWQIGECVCVHSFMCVASVHTDMHRFTDATAHMHIDIGITKI